MKLKVLKKIVRGHADLLEDCAAYSGEYGDGGCSALLRKFETYQNKWVVKMDLRPSEFDLLDEVEVGEPIEFASIIENHKIRLAKNIIL